MAALIYNMVFNSRNVHIIYRVSKWHIIYIHTYTALLDQVFITKPKRIDVN